MSQGKRLGRMPILLIAGVAAALLFGLTVEFDPTNTGNGPQIRANGLLSWMLQSRSAPEESANDAARISEVASSQACDPDPASHTAFLTERGLIYSLGEESSALPPGAQPVPNDPNGSFYYFEGSECRLLVRNCGTPSEIALAFYGRNCR